MRLFVSLALLALCACSNATSYLDKAKALAAEQNYKEAILNYQKALQKDQNLAEAMFGMAKANESLGNSPAAYYQYQQAARMAPNNESYRIALADLSLASYLNDPGKPAFLYDQVSQQAKALESLPGGKADSLRLRAFLAAADKHPEEAIGLFRQSIALKPTDDGRIGLASLLFAEKQYDEAEKILLTLLESRGFDQAYQALYGQYMNRNRVADALALLEKHVQRNPKNAQAVNALGLHHARARNEAAMKEAIGRFQNAANFPYGFALTGDFYALINQPDEALRWYAEGLKTRPNERLECLKRQANLLSFMGRKGEALQSVEEILKIEPKDENSLALKGRLNLETGKDPEGTLKQFAALTTQSPDNPLYHLYYGRALIMKNDLEAARRELASAIRLKPDLLDAHALNIELQLQQRQFGDAHTAIDELARVEPNNPRLAVWRAAAFQGQGNLGPAREQMTAALKANPNSPDALLQNGLLLVAEKRYAEADAIFRKFYVPGQGDTRPLEGLVASRLSQNQFDGALGLLKAELDRNPSPNIRLAYASAATRAARYDLALEQYRQFIAADPKSPDFHLRVGEILQLKGDFAGAAKSFEAAKALLPATSTQADSYLAFAHMNAGNNNDAIKLYRQIVAKSPDDLVSSNNLAYLLAESGQDLNEAYALVQKVQQRMPNEPSVADTVGWVLFKRGMHDTALQVFSGLVKKAPAVSAFRYHYAHVLLQKGDRAEARTQLQNALTTAPKGPEAVKIQELLKKIS
jgi:tetratricopeptide (TPR) repeat protein